MKFNYASLETCHTASGLVVVIDVLRAFSNAAYAFSRGAEEIILVSTVDEALDLKSRLPNAKVMGEVGGLPPAGFDFGNSPTQILEDDLSGLTLIQRTGAGTQGAVRCVNADIMLAASFVVADATVKHIFQRDPSEVTFVITGIHYNDEDLACAEYLEALLNGQKPDIKPFIQRVYDCKDAEQHLDPNQPEFPESDLDYCTQISRFNFSMPITRENNQLVMRTANL
jgi:2-phosphosulfolactate phosphatase